MNFLSELGKSAQEIRDLVTRGKNQYKSLPGNGVGTEPIEKPGPAAAQTLKSNLVNPNAPSFDNNSPESKDVLRKP